MVPSDNVPSMPIGSATTAFCLLLVRKYNAFPALARPGIMHFPGGAASAKAKRQAIATVRNRKNEGILSRSTLVVAKGRMTCNFFKGRTKNRFRVESR
jgi:hypothetical protein